MRFEIDIYPTLSYVPVIPSSLLSSAKSISFNENVGTSTNFESVALSSVNGFDVIKWHGIEGATYSISTMGDYVTPNVIDVTDRLGKSVSISNPIDNFDAVHGVLIPNFVAPYTGDFYVVTSFGSYNDTGSTIILEDKDTSKTINSVAIETPKITTNQKLAGTSKSDNLIGGDGNDALTGGLNFDTLTGGKGVDKFVFTSIKDAPISHSKIG